MAKLVRDTLPCLFLLLTVPDRTGQAALVTFHFTGHVQNIVSTFSPGVPLDGSITAGPSGTPVTGSFSFDTLLSDTSADAQIGSYLPPGLSFQLTVGNYQLTSGIQITVVNDFGVSNVDGYSAVGSSDSTGTVFTNGTATFGAAPGAIGPALLNFVLQDFDHTVFSSDALPAIPPPLSAFELQFISVVVRPDFSGSSQLTDIRIAFDSFTAAIVPEPASLAIWSLGALCVGWRYRRRVLKQS